MRNRYDQKSCNKKELRMLQCCSTYLGPFVPTVFKAFLGVGWQRWFSVAVARITVVSVVLRHPKQVVPAFDTHWWVLLARIAVEPAVHGCPAQSFTTSAYFLHQPL